MSIRMTPTINKLKQLTTGIAIGLLCVCSALMADDTEIFFGQQGDLNESNPNLLFILDTSGSMNNRDGTNKSRLERMKEAMHALIDQSSSFNVGFMGFSGHARGGSVRYPVGYLEGASTSQCPDSGCPDEVVVARPRHSNDDGVELLGTGAVTLDDDYINLGKFEREVSLVVPPGFIPVTETATTDYTTEESTSLSNNSLIVRSSPMDSKWMWNEQTPIDDYSPIELGFRFNNVNIPPDAIVTEARIGFKSAGGLNAAGDVSVTIRAESTGEPEHYTGYNDVLHENTPLSNRVTTSAHVNWRQIPLEASGAVVESPNLASLLQEVIGLPSWVQNGDMSFIIESLEAAPSDTEYRTFYGSGALQEYHPYLEYTYYEPSPSYAISKLTDDYTIQYIEPAVPATRRFSNSLDEQLFYEQPTFDPAVVAFLFSDLTIPDNATITNAVLYLHTSAGIGQFNANVSAEMTDLPASYPETSPDQFSRTFTTSFVEMPMGAAVDGEVASPNIAHVLEEVRALPEWTSGDSFSIKLSAGTGYTHDGTDNQTIVTRTDGDQVPRLEITYREDYTPPEDTEDLVETGIRFTNVHIPPGAIVQSAVLEFNSNTANDEPAMFEIRGESVGNASEFTSTDYDISARSKTSAGVNWTVEPWDTVGTKFVSEDIKSIVQEIVNRSDWCGGNAIGVMITGSGIRDAVSFDASSINSPALRVTYSPDTVPPGSYCSNRSAVLALSANTDDATENQSDKSVDLQAISLDLADATNGEGDIALRFRGVPVPQGASIVSSVLELTAADQIVDGLSASITAENTDDSQPFTTDTGDISNRSWTPTAITWDAVPAVESGENLFSPDLTTLVSEVINRPEWSSGNALSIRLQAASGGSGETKFHSFDSDEALSPRLIVYYQGQRSTPSTLFKDNLKIAVDELVAQDGTPIVDVLYEGARYMKGLSIDYGKRRGSQRWKDRNSRVSHPSSYTGGTLVQPGNCTDADLSASDCRWERIDGSPMYVSPMVNQCQQNHIIFLSDGVPTSNSSSAKVKAMTGDATCQSVSDSDEYCGRELVAYLHGNDHAPLLPGQQNITTHTIGFNLTEPAFLKDLASAGGGSFYPASTATELLNAFKNIFVNVSKLDASFVAPSASVNQFNRLKHRDDIYFSLFKPEPTMRWPGNIKRFKVQGNEGAAADIVDANGNVAVNEGTGQFHATARSFWSSVVDGPSVEKGGAAAEFEFMPVRKVVTYAGTSTNLMDVSNRIAVGNTNLKVADFQLNATLAADSNYVDNLIAWTAGLDVNDEDADGITDENRVHMGDPLHSQPVLLNYTSSPSNPISVIFAATNEGYLHAIDYSNGQEHFAFVPRQLFKNLRHYYENDVTSQRRYGIDGSLTTWIKDNNGNGVVDSADGDRAILYFGLRRGGRLIFALDVTDYNNPKYLWHIDGESNINDADPTTANGDWTAMGQSWSKISKTQIMGASGPQDVIMFGGGYDGNNHDPVDGEDKGINQYGFPNTDFLGRTIYIADAETGKLLWNADPEDPDFSDMKYAIPSDLRVIDINSDNMVDQVYVGDMGAQVWRFDINNDSGSDSLSSRITGGVVADFSGGGTTERRRFYYPPDVSVVSVAGTQYLSVSVGSGWRAHPLDTLVQDRFYTFRLKDVYAPPRDSYGQITYQSISETTSGMVDVSDNIGSSPVGNIGWYMKFTTPGEKALSSSVTLNGQVVFTSYVPATVLDECSAAVGSGRVYAVDVLNGDPVIALGESSSTDATSDSSDLNISHRSKILNFAGIPPAPVVLFPETGDATVLLGPEKLNGFDLGDPKKRTFWREHVDDNS